jgi:hypothetical protein
MRFYDLRSYRAELAGAIGSDFDELRSLTLHPVRIQYGPEFSTPAFASNSPPSVANLRYTDRPHGSLRLINPSASVRRITFSALLVDEAGGGSRAAVRWPDGTVQQLRVGDDGARLQRDLSLPPGQSAVEIASSRSLSLNVKQYLSLRNVSISDQRLVAVAQRADIPGATQ